MSMGEWNSLFFYNDALDLLKNEEFIGPNYWGAIKFFTASGALGYGPANYMLKINEVEWKRHLCNNHVFANLYWQQAIDAGYKLAKENS
jgi:hypothetical protein